MKDKSAKRKNESETSVKMSICESAHRAHSDVLGSYTGVPMEEEEQPVQDADDL